MKKKTQYNNRTISYAVHGTGKPVFLLHGFGEKADVWDQQVAFLQDRWQLIVPDLPGTGDSALLPDQTIAEIAEAVHAVIHAEDIEQCTVIGHSMGGYVTLALAKHYWNHVNAFGLFHSTAYADSLEKKEARRKGIAFINEHGPYEFLKASTPNLYNPHRREELAPVIARHIAGLSNFTAEALVSYYEAMMARPDTTEVLRNTRTPVLFVIGEYDNAVSPADSLEQSHLPEKAYIHILRKSGHMGMLEETAEANRILEEFLLAI